MRRRRAWRGVVAIIAGALVFQGGGSFGCGGARAAEVLTANEDCEAFSGRIRLTNPGAARLTPGRSYALKQSDDGWVQVKIPGVKGWRWVRKGCGTRQEVEVPTRPVAAERQTSRGRGRSRSSTRQCPAQAKDLRPFFEARGKVSGYEGDPTLEPAGEVAFDAKVLALCGGWGTALGSLDLVDNFDAAASAREWEALRELFDDSPDVVESVWAWTKASVPGFSQDRNGFSQTMTEIWIRANGFRHVFCGEPRAEDDRLGGLHFAPRFRQAGDNHWAGIAGNNSEAAWSGAACEGIVCTVSLCYAVPQAGNVVLPETLKSYAPGVSARRLLAEATAAFYRLDGEGETMIHADFDPRRPYWLWVVARGGGIRTAYPSEKAAPSKTGALPDERADKRMEK